ncbi:MAG TPA: hypothetical protein DDZ41_09135 [Flavobacterium sp.]|nr:hypothetical protein [Flavobacterium sp.]
MSLKQNKEVIENYASIDKDFLHALAVFFKNKILLFTVFAMIVSYFYNLPVIKYSVSGDNEFRLYDVLGVFIIYNYFNNYRLINTIIQKVFIFKNLQKFMIWASITMITTFISYITENKIVGFLQVILYMYHFWIFFLTSVYLYLYSLEKLNFKISIYIILILSILSCIVILLQNLDYVEFLWNEEYKKSYNGFLSGTLGPNKIVTGMTSLFTLCLCLGLLFEKKYSINVIIVYVALVLNIYIIIVSGSRTTYVGLIAMAIFFLIRSPVRFLTYTGMLTLIFIFTFSKNSDLQKKLDDTLQKRIFSKTDVFDSSDADIIDAYSDLGSGRDELTKNNFMHLLENPIIIPFGVGFVNHLNSKYGKSAHNMYIQSIRETGIVGFILYFGWLISFLTIKFDEFKGFSLALQGLIIAMMITLFFGEHLYIYRPLFGLLGLFLVITTIFVSSLHKFEIKS